jgi:hypothetical protein
MTGQTLKLEIKINYPIFWGITCFAHILLFLLLQAPSSSQDKLVSHVKRNPIKIHSLGVKNAKSDSSVYLKPEKPSLAHEANKPAPKKLNLSDLMASPVPTTASAKTVQTTQRPGQLPKSAPALSGIKYGVDEFKKMANDPMLQGAANLLNSRRVALNFELPEGKKLSELNESELKLYSFLRRGAIKYVASLSAEIQEFEMKNPHLHFPLTDAKQIMTGRLVFDSQGNLKQIKMVRWTNVDKLQTFFESVLKRLDTLQNPPKELWAQDGEFAVFVTLQING